MNYITSNSMFLTDFMGTLHGLQTTSMRDRYVGSLCAEKCLMTFSRSLQQAIHQAVISRTQMCLLKCTKNAEQPNCVLVDKNVPYIVNGI